jgi:hypothetical protein
VGASGSVDRWRLVAGPPRRSAGRRTHEAIGHQHGHGPAHRRRAEPGVGGGLSVRRDHRRAPDQARVDHRRAHPASASAAWSTAALQRGYPAVLRCDNGPELACDAMADWWPRLVSIPLMTLGIGGRCDESVMAPLWEVGEIAE